MIKVLIADDERHTIEAIESNILWEELGAKVIATCRNGKEAFDFAVQLKPDIIISDIKMPKMSGIELIDAIKEYLPECKFIFISGYTEKEYLKSAIRLRVISYVEKPLEMDELSRVLKNAINEINDEKKLKKHITDNTQKELCLKLINITYEEYNKGVIEAPFPKEGYYVSSIILLNSKLSNISFNNHLSNKLYDLSREQDLQIIVGNKGYDTIIINAYNENAQLLLSKMKRLLQDTFEYVRGSDNANCIICASIGETVNKIYNLSKSYMTCVAQQQKVFYRGVYSIIEYKEDSSSSYEFDNSLVEELSLALKKHEEIQAVLCFKRFFNSIRTCENTQVNSVRKMVFELMLAVNNFTNIINLNPKDYNGENIWTDISNTITLKEIENIVMATVENVFVTINNKYQKNDIIVRAMQYIDENLSAYDLSVRSISKELYVSDAYLCSLFKKKVSTTINQYILRRRMELADQLFKTNTRIKICKVANMVGYKDPKYFTKTFKKYFGVTPREYGENAHE